MTDGASIRALERRLAAAPASPLFARLAAGLLSHGEIARAESLCERGIELYPHYATGRIVRARCLAARGRYAEALEALEAVEAAYPGNIVLDGLEEEWRALAGAAPPPPEADDGAVFTDLPHAGSPGMTIADDGAGIGVTEAPTGESPAATPASAAEPAAEAAVVPEPAEAPAPPDHTEVLSAEGVDPPAPVPASHVGTVPILQPVPRPLSRTSFIGQDRIVSRTLAEIYASQGAINEAVETYRILLEKMPERSGQLGGRLRELEERLRTDPGPRPVREE